MVTDSEMVRETILLPEAGPGALKVFRCGVTNCGVTFTAQPEVVLRAHMEAVHGSYYVKLGKGKYLLRFCRICGEDRCFTTEKELLAHISTCHPPEQFGQRLSDGEEEERQEVKQEVVEEGEVNLNNNLVQEEDESLTSGLMNNVGNRPRSLELSPRPSTSSVLAEEAIELAAKTTSPKEGKGEKKRKRKKKQLESTSEESSESSSDDEDRASSKRKKKSKKGVKEKIKKKAPIEEKKKKFKDQVGKMSPEEIRQHILKMKEKADKLLKKKSFKELKEDSEPVAKKRFKPPLSSLPDPKDPWPRTINDKTAHYFCLVCNIYAGKLERWLLHREYTDHIEAYSSTKEAALQRHDCAEINLQECVIGEEKFEKAPIGQCRECFQVGK